MSGERDPALGDTVDAASATAQALDETVSSAGRRPAAPVPPPRRPEDLAAGDADRYYLQGEVARGGLGRIVRAIDRRLGRPVALKELLFRGGGDSAARFVREAVLTARLEHPAVVPVHDLGRDGAGAPYYAMKVVSGRTLEACAREAASARERMALLPNVIAVAEAMAYAHAQRIIHRDLKPANVLIGAYGETVVIDWGLAKDLDAPGEGEADARSGPYRADASDATQAGAVMGTPAYMPPEQAAGEAVDERADVYALGAMIYHLLGGVPPYRGKSSDDVLTAVMRGPPEPLAARAPATPPDLLAIVDKAMARAPAARYPHAGELAAELRRFQTGQLVGAHRYSLRELVARWLRRHRAVLAVAAAALLVLVVGGVLALRQIVAARDRARANLALALARSDELVLDRARQAVGNDPTEAVAWLGQLSPRFDRWAAARMIAAGARARGVARVLLGHTRPVHQLAFAGPGRLLSGDGAGEVRLWELGGGVSRVLGRTGHNVSELVVAPGGDEAASGGQDGSVTLWPLGGGAPRTLLGHRAAVWVVRYSPDGSRLATLASDGEVRLWQRAAGTSERLWHSTPGSSALAFSSNGERILAERAGAVVVRELASGADTTLPAVPEAGALQGCEVSPDGKLLVVVHEHEVRVWPTDGAQSFVIDGDNAARARSEPSRRGLPTYLLAPRFSPRGGYLSVLSTIGGQLVFRVRDFAQVGALEAHRLLFAPDDSWVAATQGGAPTVALYALGDTLGSAPIRTLAGHQEEPVALVAAGDRLASGGTEGTVRVWDLGEGRAPPPLEAPGLTGWVALDQAPVAMVGFPGSGDIVWVDLHDGQRRVLTSAQHQATTLALAPGGGAVAWADVPAPETPGTSTLHVWEAATGAARVLGAVRETTPSGGVRRLQFSPDARHLSAVVGDGTVWRWPLAGGPERVYASDERAVQTVALSPDGRWLATGSRAGAVTLWELASGQRRVLGAAASSIEVLACSPDSSVVVSGSFDGELRVWPVAGGPPRSLGRHDTTVTVLALSRDGRQLASGGSDRTVRLWDLAGRLPARTLGSHDGELLGLAFAPDGRRILSSSRRQTMLWDVGSGERRLLDSRGSDVVRFSPDGRTLFWLGPSSLGADQLARAHDDLPESPAALQAWLHSASNVTIQAGKLAPR